MDRVFIEIFGRPIYWYGVLTALGFLAAVLNWNLLGKRENRQPGLGSEIGIWVMVCGILGARVAFILANLETYLADPLEMFRIDRGGLIYYGGLMGAVGGLALFARIRKEPLGPFADFVITGVPVGHALGRIGCFMNGCCWGTPTELPWHVFMEGALRHPTQLYEAALNLVLFAGLHGCYRRSSVPGRVFALYLVGYGLIRFFIEFLRGDERDMWNVVTVAQGISLGLIAAGCLLWFFLPRRTQPQHA